MNFKIKCGDLILVRSDTVFSANKDPIAITIEDEYTLKFTFLDDTTNPEQDIDVNTQNEGVELILKNFNNPLGTSISKPIEFAKLNGRSIYIAFAVYAVSSTKVLHFNIYVDN